MRACASFGVSLVVRLGAMSVAFEGGIVSAGGLQNRQLPPAARPRARPTAVDALMDALDEQYEEDKSFAEMFDPAQSKVQCAFAFEVAARSVQKMFLSGVNRFLTLVHVRGRETLSF
jgi:hypothetical protein